MPDLHKLRSPRRKQDDNTQTQAMRLCSQNDSRALFPHFLALRRVEIDKPDLAAQRRWEVFGRGVFCCWHKPVPCFGR